MATEDISQLECILASIAHISQDKRGFESVESLEGKLRNEGLAIKKVSEPTSSFAIDLSKSVGGSDIWLLAFNCHSNQSSLERIYQHNFRHLQAPKLMEFYIQKYYHHNKEAEKCLQVYLDSQSDHYGSSSEALKEVSGQFYDFFVNVTQIICSSISNLLLYVLFGEYIDGIKEIVFRNVEGGFSRVIVTYDPEHCSSSKFSQSLRSPRSALFSFVPFIARIINISVNKENKIELLEEIISYFWSTFAQHKYYVSDDLRQTLREFLFRFLDEGLGFSRKKSFSMKSGFSFHSCPLSLYIHGVSGAGKSTFVRYALSALKSTIVHYFDPLVNIASLRISANRSPEELFHDFHCVSHNNDLSAMTLLHGQLSKLPKCRQTVVILLLEEFPSSILHSDSEDFECESHQQCNNRQVFVLQAIQKCLQTGLWISSKSSTEIKSKKNSNLSLDKESKCGNLPSNLSLLTFLVSNYDLSVDASKYLSTSLFWNSFYCFQFQSINNSNRSEFFRDRILSSLSSCIHLSPECIDFQIVNNCSNAQVEDCRHRKRYADSLAYWIGRILDSYSHLYFSSLSIMIEEASEWLPSWSVEGILPSLSNVRGYVHLRLAYSSGDTGYPSSGTPLGFNDKRNAAYQEGWLCDGSNTGRSLPMKDLHASSTHSLSTLATTCSVHTTSTTTHNGNFNMYFGAVESSKISFILHPLLFSSPDLVLSPQSSPLSTPESYDNDSSIFSSPLPSYEPLESDLCDSFNANTNANGNGNTVNELDVPLKIEVGVNSAMSPKLSLRSVHSLLSMELSLFDPFSSPVTTPLTPTPTPTSISTLQQCSDTVIVAPMEWEIWQSFWKNTSFMLDLEYQEAVQLSLFYFSQRIIYPLVIASRQSKWLDQLLDYFQVHRDWEGGHSSHSHSHSHGQSDSHDHSDSHGTSTSTSPSSVIQDGRRYFSEANIRKRALSGDKTDRVITTTITTSQDSRWNSKCRRIRTNSFNPSHGGSLVSTTIVDSPGGRPIFPLDCYYVQYDLSKWKMNKSLNDPLKTPGIREDLKRLLSLLPRTDSTEASPVLVVDLLMVGNAKQLIHYEYEIRDLLEDLSSHSLYSTPKSALTKDSLIFLCRFEEVLDDIQENYTGPKQEDSTGLSCADEDQLLSSCVTMEPSWTISPEILSRVTIYRE